MAYESPIRICEKITEDIITKTEDGIIEEVKVQVGYDIDKAELIKALEYDRGQYEKGYEDGKKDAVKHGRWEKDIEVDPFAEQYYVRWKCSECGHKKRGRWVRGLLYAKRPKDNYCLNCGAKMDLKEELECLD